MTNEIAIADLSATEAVYQITSQYADGMPWSYTHYVDAARREMQLAADAYVRACRLVHAIRALATDEQWRQAVDALGVDDRTARRMSEVGRRIPATGAHAPRLASLSQSRVIELLALPDADLAELADNGSTQQGLGLDEIDTLTVRELKQRLREMRQTVDAMAKRAEARERQIDRANGTDRAREQERDIAVQKLDIALRAARAAFGSIAPAVEQVADLDPARALGALSELRTVAVQIAAQITEICTDYDIDTVGGVLPGWMAQPA